MDLIGGFMRNYFGNMLFLIHLSINVQIKPHSNICPNIAKGVFKGFLSRALHISSVSYLAQQIEFLINAFVENGHSIKVLEKKSPKNI